MLTEKSISEFLREVSSDSPAPGGGSVAALSGASAAALVVMVANLTVAKKGYEQVQQEMEMIRQECVDLRDQLINDIDRDADAYNEVISAYKLTRETEAEKKDRFQAIQSSLKTAASVPLEVAKRGLVLYELATKAMDKGNKNCITDGAVATFLARSAVLGAVMNVKINLPEITDLEFVAEVLQEVECLENGVK